jgi:hypothetical protein
MSEEYDLKKSENKIGQLYPILVSKDGKTIDGFHRKAANANWKELVVPEIDNDEKLLIARLVANWHRRPIDREEKEKWINDLADLYKKQGLKVGSHDDGKSNEIKQKIVEVTGLEESTIREYLSDEFKQETPEGWVVAPTPVLEKAEKALGEDGLKQLKKQILKEDKLSPQEKAALTKKRQQDKETRKLKREENKRIKEEKRKEHEEQIRKQAEESAKEKLLHDKQFLKDAAKIAPSIQAEETKLVLPFDIPSVDQQLDKLYSAMAKIKPTSKKDAKASPEDFVVYIRSYLTRKKIVCPTCGEAHLQWRCGHDF